MMHVINIDPSELNLKTQICQFLLTWTDPQLYLELEPRQKIKLEIISMSVSLATPGKVSATSYTLAVHKMKEKYL